MERFNKCGFKFVKKEINWLKYLLISAIIIIVLLNIANICLFYKNNKNIVYAESCDINASSYIVIDASNGNVFAGKNIDKRLPMASTTKIMTAILAIENLNLDKCININPKAVGVEGSSIYLKLNKKYKIRDLLYGLMLRSGNDAAEALAYEVSGSIEEFANLMNKKAKELNLENTHFTNPHGLHNKEHYTSAYDLAMISAYAMKNRIFAEMVSSKMHIIDADDTVYYNKNKLLSIYDGANGIKTGYTTISGKCLVSAAKRDGVQIIAVVLDCYDMWNASMNLLDFAFNQYKEYKLTPKNTIILKTQDNGIIINEPISLLLKENDSIKINYDFNFNNIEEYPTKKENPIGYINIYNNNCLLFSKKIYTIEAMKTEEEFELLKSILIGIHYGTS